MAANGSDEPNYHLIFSGDEKEMEELKQVVINSGARDVKFVPQALLLADSMAMPFLDTRDGRHIVGLDAIREFILESAGVVPT